MMKTRLAIVPGLALLAVSASAQTLALSPAVVQLRGEFGQSTTQTLTLSNSASQDADFALQALDVVADGGQRRMLRAGELPGSIAATAVFVPEALHVPAGESRSVQLTLTLVPGTRERAVVAQFRCLTPFTNGRLRSLASLGALLTFTTSGPLSLAAQPLTALPPSPAREAGFALALVNDGSEPLMARGVVALLDAAGRLVGKAPLEPHRLLPGEAGTLQAEYGGELAPGRYRAVATVESEAGAFTREAELWVQ